MTSFTFNPYASIFFSLKTISSSLEESPQISTSDKSFSLIMSLFTSFAITKSFSFFSVELSTTVIRGIL